jgi:hypothetical protein
MTGGSVKNFPPRLPIFFKHRSVTVLVNTSVQTVDDKLSGYTSNARTEALLWSWVKLQKNVVVRGDFS